MQIYINVLKFLQEITSQLVMSYSNNPHFFVIVLAHVLKEQRLEIPKEFVRQHGMKAFLNNQTCLTVADGKKWNVGLTKCNGKVWFHHGWEKFVEFYSVGLEYFLVFKYEKQSSSFGVVIFDLTATEIDYAMTKNRRDEVKMEKMETSLDALHLSSYSQDYKVRLNGAIKGKKSGRKRPSTTSQRAIAMAKAASVQSMTLNPSFMCKIWPSNVSPGKHLTVPLSFSKMHVEDSRNSRGMNLEVSDGRIWSVHYRAYWSPKMIKKMTCFTRGWKIFARENNLEAGDACVFEMVRKNRTRISFKVQIFRAS